jgi:hypothetical protein
LLIYEIRVPLTQNESNSFALSTGKNGVIGIGLETTKIDFSGMQQRQGRFGGRRPEGGMPPGGMPGGRRAGFGQRPQMSEQLNVWAKVQLASE